MDPDNIVANFPFTPSLLYTDDLFTYNIISSDPITVGTREVGGIYFLLVVMDETTNNFETVLDNQ